jgi:hypothetical protein
MKTAPFLAGEDPFESKSRKIRSDFIGLWPEMFENGEF